MAKRTNGTRRKAARTNDVSPEVAAELAQPARRMRQLVYGGGPIPEWGTKFSEIESEGMNVGWEPARLFMEQSVDEQVGEVPDVALECHGETNRACRSTGRTSNY